MTSPGIAPLCIHRTGRHPCFLAPAALFVLLVSSPLCSPLFCLHLYSVPTLSFHFVLSLYTLIIHSAIHRIDLTNHLTTLCDLTSTSQNYKTIRVVRHWTTVTTQSCFRFCHHTSPYCVSGLAAYHNTAQHDTTSHTTTSLLPPDRPLTSDPSPSASGSQPLISWILSASNVRAYSRIPLPFGPLRI